MSEYINHGQTENNDIKNNKSTKMINNNNNHNNHASDSSGLHSTTTNSDVRIDIKSSCVNDFMSSSDLSLASDIVIESAPIFDNFGLPSCIPNGTNHSISGQKTANNSDNLMNGQQNNNNENKSNNPKEFGKFRILKEYTANNDHDLKNAIDSSSYLNMNGSIQLNGSYDGINDISNEVDVLATDNDSIVENGKEPTKRRGKPKKPTAKKKTNQNNQHNNSKDDHGHVDNFDMSNEDEFQTRRRSKRLRNLEKNNPTENDSAQTCSQPSKNSNSVDSTTESVVVNGDIHSSANENPSSTNKSKSNKKNKSKHKSKTKDNNKNSSKKHEAKSKAKHKSEHKKHNNSAKSHSSKENNFTLPQEPCTLTKESTTINNIDNENDDDSTSKPEKVKSRWRRNSELDNTTAVSNSTASSPNKNENEQSSKNHHQVLQDCTNEKANTNELLPSFVEIEDNHFLFEKKKCKSKKETKKMVCDCILTKEERNKGLMGCGEDCLNRMLMIECGSRCTLEDHCSNKRFQKKQNCKVKPFKTEKKGWGLMALEPIPPDTFIMEYVGEVIDPFMFHKRVEKYSKSKIEHYYFMALKSDEIIDATTKGNITRFINHSCEPNAMTQKWTVNGELRIGFFSIKPINPGEEITFDYQFQRYGKKAQRCYCETKSCRGYIGTSENANILTDGSKIPKKVPKTDHDAEEEEDEDEDDEIMEEEDFLEDLALEEEIDMLAENGGLRNRQQILVVSRLMLRAERCELRIQLIDIIMATVELAYLRLFLDYHGLQIIWGWMVEADDVDLKARLLELLEILPIPNKTMLVTSKVWQVVERWAAPDSLESQQYLHINDDTMNKEGKDEKDNKNGKNEKEAEAAIKTETIEETNETTDVDNDKSDGKKPTKTEPETPDKETVNGEKRTAEPLAASKLSGKIVIKTKSKANINENGSQTTTNPNAKNKTNVTIGFLAQKLLTHWKDLKEVFTIPRLERQKRRDDEAEADRRAREEEERRAQGLPMNYDDRRSISHRNYAIAGILGKNRETYRGFSSRIAYKRHNHHNHSSSSSLNNNSNNFMLNNNNNSNNSHLNSTSPAKISKEDFRKRFEMNVAHSEYSEMLKKYKQQLSLYNSHMAQQWRTMATLQQNNNSNNDGNKAVNSVAVLNELYRQYSKESTNDNAGGAGNVKTSVQQYVAPSFAAINQFADLLMDASYQAEFNQTNLTSLVGTSQHSDLITAINAVNELDYMDVDFKDLIPDYQSPLVVLSDNDSCFQNDSTLSPYAIDNVDFSQIKFESDNCIESMEKKMFDEMYPPAGIFYVTKKGRTYFVALPKNDFTQGGIIVKENLTEPLPLSFTQKQPDDRLLSTICDWKCSTVDGHHYYYNKRKQIKQWHPPQDNQIDNYINDDDQPMDTLCDFSHASTCSSPPSIHRHSGGGGGGRRKEESYRKKKRIKEQFRNRISQFVVKCLNPYMKSSCRKARITNSDDFKNLARKLTHTIVGKELKQCKHIKDLSYTESVKIKTKEYVKRYMSRFGSVYRKESSREKSISPSL